MGDNVHGTVTYSPATQHGEWIPRFETLDKRDCLFVNPPPMPATYRRNKLKTALDIIRRIENWPTAMDMRLRQSRPGMRLLRFRDGLNVVCRGGSRDWDVLHELMFAGGYGLAMEAVRAAKEAPTVLDLGGNIGLFSLLSASQRPDVTVHAFEPGPPNFRMFEMNLLANEKLSGRVHLTREAVGGTTSTVQWFFDEKNPGGSSLYGTSGTSFPVQIRAFAEVLAPLKRVTLAKVDIEGAEYDLIRETPSDAWKKVAAVSLELHDDPSGHMSQSQFLDRMKILGYSITEESVCSYFLRRQD